MGVEKTIEFILNQQTQATAKIQELAERQNRAEVQIQTLAEQQTALVAVVREQQAQITTIVTALGVLTERVDSLARAFEEWLRRSGDGSRPN